MWVGVYCGVEAHELLKWAGVLRRVGAGSEGAEGCALFLEDAATLVSGMGAAAVDEKARLAEIEMRAADEIERKRNDVAAKGSAIVQRMMGGGVDVARVMGAAGMSGWNMGREAGGKHGGTANSRRAAAKDGGKGSGKGSGKNGGKHGGTANSRRAAAKDGGKGSGKKSIGRTARTGKAQGKAGSFVRDTSTGSVVSSAGKVSGDGTSEGRALLSKGGCAGVSKTLKTDEYYGKSWEGWAANELRKLGYKMKDVARAVELDASSAWRYISGYGRYWKRQGLAGVTRPPITDQVWLDRFEVAERVASRRGFNGAPTKTRADIAASDWKGRDV